MKLPAYAISMTTALVALSGCATSVWEAKWGGDKPHISYVSLNSAESQLDKLYVWNPNNNAAYIFKNAGNEISACVASADVAKARNYENEVNVDLGKVLDKVDSASVSEKLKVIETVTKLTDKGESASFLNVAMFHICMMAGSGKITEGQANELMALALQKSVDLSTQQEGVATPK